MQLQWPEKIRIFLPQCCPDPEIAKCQSLTDKPFGVNLTVGVVTTEINYDDYVDAIIDSGVSRLRPVGMAAATTILGMIPLFTDAFYIAMAVTIVGGLAVATVLTMVVVPVLYAIFFKAKKEDAGSAVAAPASP